MRANLEILSICDLEKKLAQSASGSAEERAIRRELLERQMRYADDHGEMLPLDYEAKRQELRAKGHDI